MDLVSGYYNAIGTVSQFTHIPTLTGIYTDIHTHALAAMDVSIIAL